jgi:GMP synthase-like glutamine amidotransferase
MRVLIIKNGSLNPNLYSIVTKHKINKKNINAIEHQTEELNLMDDNEIDELIDNIDAVIIGGGKQSVVELEKYKELSIIIDIIMKCGNLNKPVLGICLGCQLIGVTYGLSVRTLQNPHIGPGYLSLETINPQKIENDNFLSKLDWSIVHHAFSFHYDGLIDSEDSNGKIQILGKSNSDVPYIIKHKSKPIYGLQFHPEMDATLAIILLKLSGIKDNKIYRKILDNIEKMDHIKEMVVTEFLLFVEYHNSINFV